MAEDLQLVIRLRAEGAGQVAAVMESVGQSVGTAARTASGQVGESAASIARSLDQLSRQAESSGESVVAANRQIGASAEASSAQLSMARRIVVSNLVNMGQAAIVTRGNLIATLSPLPDVLYGISQMGAEATATARAVMVWGAALTAVVGGFAAVLAHAATTATRTRELTVLLKAMGDSAGITGERLRMLSENAATIGPFGRSETHAATKVLAAHPLIPGGMHDDLLTTAVNFSAATGQQLISGVSALATAMERGYAGIRQLDEGLHFLSTGELEQIRVMSRHGQQTEAMGVALDALNRRFKGLAAEGMSASSKAFHEMSNAFSHMMDRLAGSDFVQDRMKDLTSLFNWLATPPKEPLQAEPSPSGSKSPATEAGTQTLPVVNTRAIDDDSAKQIDELRARLARETRVLNAPAPRRPLAQAALAAEELTQEKGLNAQAASQARLLLTAQAYRQIESSARDATAVMQLNADAQERVARAAQISDAAMRRAALENDIARFSYEHLGVGVEAYRKTAERAFAGEEQGRRSQWIREIDNQAAAADRLSEAYRRHGAAAIEAAERENQIQAAIKQVGVTAEQAAAQVDKLFNRKWDQTALQMNRSNDYRLDYRMKMEELEKAKATGILTDQAYAEQAKKNHREMLDASREWSDGARRAMASYLDEAGNAAKQSEKLFTKALQGMEDVLVGFAKTGKLEFGK
ncbi:MAG: phage tail length tape measure family protein, partial [Magnetococcales bacterium]|nr:phage tail length tape measure family protein [Magnetococcales bacterium]